MTLQVTTLDGTPAPLIERGEEYLVPCVYGIPVICPSHVDAGNDGPTGKHWHTDERFGGVNRVESYWHKETWKEVGGTLGNTMRSDILKDEGQPVRMEQKLAFNNTIAVTGGVFTSQVWLYHTLGTQDANGGHCVHHRTPLVEQHGCLQCPAHGLKYKKDGSPRYKAPFYVSLEYTDWGGKILRAKEGVTLDKGGIKFSVEGAFSLPLIITLEDSDGEVITKETNGFVPFQGIRGRNNFAIIIGAWPSSGMCPRLAPSDPRGWGKVMSRRLHRIFKKFIKIRKTPLTGAL